MKRYMVFAGRHDSPTQGADDITGAFEELRDATASAVALLGIGYEWSHVFDVKDWQIVWEGDTRCS